MHVPARSSPCVAVAGLLVMGGVLAGCGARMALPPDVRAAADELHVDGRSLMAGSVFVKDDFKMGDYAVTDVSHGGSGATRYPTFTGFQVDDERTVAFTVKGPTASLKGTCVADASESDTQLDKATLTRTAARFACACGDESAPEAQLALALPAPGLGIRGTMTAAGVDYAVKALYDLEGAGPIANPSGYRVDGPQGVAGAVDVLGGGRAWMGRSLAPAQRLDFACIYAGLFFYRPPNAGAPPATQ